MMLTEDTKNIIQGRVRSEKGWVSIEEKLRIEEQRKKKIKAGLVFFQGEWITIEDKIARVSPAPQALPQEQQPMVVNKTVNKQTYNVYTDNRTMNENIHEHRHVHIEPDQIGGEGWEKFEAPRKKEISSEKRKQIGRRGPAGEIMPPS